jgi:hypothetical protein
MRWSWCASRSSTPSRPPVAACATWQRGSHPHPPVAGALPERFLRSLLHPLRHRGRELALVVGDPTKVFLWKRSPGWYRRQGVHLWALERTALGALTVNPIAPQSHGFDSAELRARMAEAIPDVPVFDVLSADYIAAREVAPSI